MEKKDIVKSMKQQTNGAGMITQKGFAVWMGFADQYKAKRRYLEGLEAVDGKYYLIDDIADRLIERKAV